MYNVATKMYVAPPNSTRLNFLCVQAVLCEHRPNVWELCNVTPGAFSGSSPQSQQLDGSSSLENSWDEFQNRLQILSQLASGVGNSKKSLKLVWFKKAHWLWQAYFKQSLIRNYRHSVMLSLYTCNHKFTFIVPRSDSLNYDKGALIRLCYTRICTTGFKIQVII